MQSASPAPMVGRRVTWVDSAKGLGITLVVLGHALRGLVSAKVTTWTPTAQFADTWIYAFHMPLFFFLSGLFLYRSTLKPWPSFIWDRFRTIAYPYFIWSLITVLIKSPLGDAVNYPRTLSDLPLIFYEPIEQFWFLYVLFLLIIMAGFLVKIGSNVWLNLLFAALIYPGILPIPALKWIPLDQVRFFAIFLALGAIAGRYCVIDTLPLIAGRWLGLLVALGLALSALPAEFETQSFLFRFSAAVSGTMAIVALAGILERARLDTVTQFLGRYTLEIFVAHTIVSAATRMMLQKFTELTSPILYLLFGTVAGLVIPILLAIALRRAGLPVFRLPYTATARSTVAPSPPLG